ncbi:hypothetical protein [Anseongella ginsenosidimutans]
MHDRIVYETGEIYKADADKTTGQWRIHRLAP